MNYEETPFSIDIWISEPAKSRVEEWLKPYMVGLEFGSGCSTIWLAKRVKNLVSVEHDESWYERIKGLIIYYNIENVALIHAEPENYLDVLKKVSKESLDFVFNDGLAELRNECIMGSWLKLKLGGMMIIDNSEAWHSKKGIKYIEKNGGVGTRYRGAVTNPWTGRYNKKGVETSIWKKWKL
jgi:hypothetical protein